MKHEILALLPGRPDVPKNSGFAPVTAGDYTAVFVPATGGLKFGRALRRSRLAAAPERQAWLETLMRVGPVLPFAPGAELNFDEAEALVIANRELLDGLATRLSGRVQYQITVAWAEDRVLDQFRAAPEIVGLFQSERVSASAVAGAVARLSDRLASVIASRLSAVSKEFAELPREAGLVSNSVLLIDAKDEPVLDAALEEVDTMWSDGFRIRQVGPSPATSFATLRLRRYGAREVHAAYDRLQLRPPTTDTAIRQSRRRLLRAPAPEVEAIRAAARLAAAACAFDEPASGVVLLDLWSEGRSAQPCLDHVA